MPVSIVGRIRRIHGRSQLAEKDLQRFLQKVNHLNGLVQSLHEHPERRQQLAACDDHNSVVAACPFLGF